MAEKRRSMKFSINILFIVLMVTTFGVICFFVFTNWKVSTDNIVTKMENDTNVDILSEVGRYIDKALYINEANHNLLENGIVDINNKTEREKYFVGVMKSNNEEVYSFSYGTENGEYYGARRNKENGIEIMENNAGTNGNSRYYSIREDFTAGELVSETGKFDPRIRDWYKAAKEQQKPVFSSTYKHFVMDDLAVSAAYPIYNKNGVLEGVLGTHITLSKINNYLKETVRDKNAAAYIIEKETGELVGNSLDKPNFVTLKDNSVKRITIEEIDNKPMVEAYQNYKVNAGNESIIDVGNDKIHVTLTDYDRDGLNWLIITSIPESSFNAEIIRSIRLSILISVIALMLAIFIYIKSTEIVLKPIYNLINITEKFSKGDFSQRAKIFKNNEIGKLSYAFNKMASQLHILINTLEEKVKERTAELEKTNEEIVYLSYHDQLTGLYNRRYFEEELKRLDSEENYPLTVVMADMNGLKLVNDSLGHATGDELLKKVAEVITKGCRKGDIVARLGGDEFVILLPKTEEHQAEQIIKRIQDMALDEKVGPIDISISFGYMTKQGKEENVDEILKKAEDSMYKKKLYESPSMRGRTINTITSTFYEKNKREEAHSHRVSKLCKSFGEALSMGQGDIDELKTAGLLHDIGKIAIEEIILGKPGSLSESEWEEIKRHPEIAYRILSTVNDMSEIAEYVLTHHERWDGKGYPKGLKEREIPLQARIISITDAYDAMISERSYKDPLSQEAAIEELKRNAGVQFDPDLVKVFIEKVLDKPMVLKKIIN